MNAEAEFPPHQLRGMKVDADVRGVSANDC